MRNSRALAVVILALAVMTVGQGLYFTMKDREVSSCLATYSAKTNEALKIRSEITDQRQVAFNNLLRDLLAQPPKSKEAGRRITQTYVDKQQKLDRERAKHPLPTVPKCQ